MGRNRKPTSMPHLNDCKGDLSKQWYVEYSLTHPTSGKKVNKRLYAEINKPTTHYERQLIANAIIKEYTDKINSGWRPWAENDTFEDALAYHNSKTFFPNVSCEKSYIKPLIADYLKAKSYEVNKTSLEDYRSKFRQFAHYCEAVGALTLPLTHFNNEFILSFLKALHDRGLARKTVYKYQQILNGLFNYIRKTKKIDIPDPFADDIPRMGKIVDQSPSSIPEFVRNLLRREIEKSDPQLWLAINFIYYTAIRPGTELRLLKIKQINFASQCVTVTNDLAKNNRTETIDMPNPLMELLLQWNLQQYNQELYIFSKNGKPGTSPMGKNTMRTRFNKVRDGLNLSKDFKYYSFKHSGAQELLISGANIYEIKAHLRHSSLETTEGYLKKHHGNRNENIKKNFPRL